MDHDSFSLNDTSGGENTAPAAAVAAAPFPLGGTVKKPDEPIPDSQTEASAAAPFRLDGEVKTSAEAMAGMDALLGNPEIRRVVFPDGVRFESSEYGTVTSWWKDGKLHRDHREGPASIEVNSLGTVEHYYEHGEFHRPSALGPAVRCIASNGVAYSEGYFEHGRKHRDPKEGPAHIFRDSKTKRVIDRDYYVDGEQIRFLRYHPDGSLMTDVWKRDGVMHRDPAEGPAAMWRAGCETRTQYFVNGRCHRDPAEGPASIVRTFMGEPIEAGYWVHGEELRTYRSKRLKRAWNRAIRRSARAVRSGNVPQAGSTC